MTNDTLKYLIDNSVRVTSAMIAISPQFFHEEVINVSKIIAFYPGCYAIKNSTIAYVYGARFYVTPYTRRIMQILKENNFSEANFFVPFSNWEYPKYEEEKWDLLRKKARKSYEEDFVNDCLAYCDEHNIGIIREENLQNSFKMPNDGVEVTGNRYYPVIKNFFLDSYSVKKIGTYSARNGNVVYVYRNGYTYVTKGYSIISELRKAGFRENRALFVPFCNGEEIRDPSLKKKWDSIK